MKLVVISACEECGWCQRPVTKWKCENKNHPDYPDVDLEDRGTDIDVIIDPDCPLPDMVDPTQMQPEAPGVPLDNDEEDPEVWCDKCVYKMDEDEEIYCEAPNNPCRNTVGDKVEVFRYCPYKEGAYDLPACLQCKHVRTEHDGMLIACEHRDHEDRYSTSRPYEMVLKCPLQEDIEVPEEVTMTVNDDLVGCVECEYLEYQKAGTVKCCNTSHPECGMHVSNEDELFSQCPSAVRKAIAENIEPEKVSCFGCENFYEHEDKPGNYFCGNEAHPNDNTLFSSPDSIIVDCPMPGKKDEVEQYERLKNIADSMGIGEAEKEDKMCNGCKFLEVSDVKGEWNYICRFGHVDDHYASDFMDELYSKCEFKKEERNSKCQFCPNVRAGKSDGQNIKYSCEKLPDLYDKMSKMEAECPLEENQTPSPCTSCDKYTLISDLSLTGVLTSTHMCSGEPGERFADDIDELHDECPKKPGVKVVKLTKNIPCNTCGNHKIKKIEGEKAPVHWCTRLGRNHFYYDIMDLAKLCPL